MVGHLGYNVAERLASSKNTTYGVTGKETDDELWENLQPTLSILRKVCSSAADWVEERHDSGHLVWRMDSASVYATYNYVSKDLSIYRILLNESDGVKASILAHEFRHSRQNFAKWFNLGLACFLSSDPSLGIIEDDAYYFEQQVYLAIFD